MFLLRIFPGLLLGWWLLTARQTDTIGQAPPMPNVDFDTGHATRLGEYPLADRTYGKWVRELAKEDFKRVTPIVQQHMLAFFSNAAQTPADAEEKEQDNRRETLAAVEKLRVLKL